MSTNPSHFTPTVCPKETCPSSTGLSGQVAYLGHFHEISALRIEIRLGQTLQQQYSQPTKAGTAKKLWSKLIFVAE